MRLFTAVLTRNEAGPDRYLRQVLARCKSFSDEVLLLDDRSTDATPEIAKELGCIVRTRKALDSRMWGAESAAREQLWDFALEYATRWDDWLLIADADMEMVGDIRGLCQTTELNCWCARLYDVWSEDLRTYRSDQFWQGHEHSRPWLFAPRRVPEGWAAEWPDRGLHSGHFPPNMPLISGIMPHDTHYWLHYAYSSPKLRAEKRAQYLAKAHLLTDFERAHADSITALDPTAGPP